MVRAWPTGFWTREDIAVPEAPREADEDAVAKFLALMPASNSQTFFAGIERVQPGIRETRTGLQAVDWHEGLNGARSEAAAEFQRIGSARRAAGSLDMKMMQRRLDKWHTAEWNRPSTKDRYQLSLLRGLSGGQFIRKVAGDNG